MTLHEKAKQKSSREGGQIFQKGGFFYAVYREPFFFFEGLPIKYKDKKMSQIVEKVKTLP